MRKKGNENIHDFILFSFYSTNTTQKKSQCIQIFIILLRKKNTPEKCEPPVDSFGSCANDNLEKS